MKNLILFLAFFFLSMTVWSQNDSKIRLLVRGDDIGSFHAANLGCIESYKNGIMRSVEIMVPCPWYPEAVKMLNENPGLDVGVHLVMTSEWDNMKWRPLTGISSFTDEQGYFFPMVWPNENFPAGASFRESEWKLEDVEEELRAQIELAKRDIKNLSHISTHMGFASADPGIQDLVDRLAKEYDLYIDMETVELKRLKVERDKSADFETQAAAFVEAIHSMESGTYLFIEHPALNTKEMETIGHKGYYNVGYDREGVTAIFTSDIVKQAIKEKNVILISYQDLKR
jgi:predicted glycoside hydrolase/deacetylase ChbG (UPF0249 family)